MYKSIGKFFSFKNRSKIKSSKNKIESQVDQIDGIENKPCLSLSNTINYRPTNKQRSTASKNKQILINTTVEVHELSSEQVMKSHHDSEELNESDIHKTSNILLAKNSKSPLTYNEKSEMSTRDSELHRYILEDVAEFYQQFSNLQTDVRILISKNVIIYVLGTNHANTQCKDDVIDIIKKVKPKTVLVELCSLRACSCQRHKSNAFQSQPKFTFRYLRAIITQLGFLPAMIFFTDVFREHLVAENSLLHYGGEFIAAMATAQALKNCRIILADRPIEITVKRQASAMGNWRGLKVTSQVTMALMFRRRMKQLMLSANRLVFDDPKTYEVLVFERDIFLTYSIQEAAKEFENANAICRVVAVIGQGHMQGIQTYWGKVPTEFIPFIMAPQTILD